MAKDNSIIERLRDGERILCIDCKKGHYVTAAKNIKVSHEFCCDKCGSAIRITPNVIVE